MTFEKRMGVESSNKAFITESWVLILLSHVFLGRKGKVHDIGATTHDTAPLHTVDSILIDAGVGPIVTSITSCGEVAYNASMVRDSSHSHGQYMYVWILKLCMYKYNE